MKKRIDLLCGLIANLGFSLTLKFRLPNSNRSIRELGSSCEFISTL